MQEGITKKLHEEEKRNKDLGIKFRKCFEGLSKIMEINNIDRFKLHDDNVDLTKKIQMLRENLIKADTQTAAMKREIELQKQLNESKISKSRLESTIEKQKLEHDIKLLELKLTEREEMCQHLEEKVKILEEKKKKSAKLVDDIIRLGIGAAAEDKGETAEGEILVAEATKKLDDSQENDEFPKESEM